MTQTWALDLLEKNEDKAFRWSQYWHRLVSLELIRWISKTYSDVTDGVHYFLTPIGQRNYSQVQAYLQYGDSPYVSALLHHHGMATRVSAYRPLEDHPPGCPRTIWLEAYGTCEEDQVDVFSRSNFRLLEPWIVDYSETVWKYRSSWRVHHSLIRVPKKRVHHPISIGKDPTARRLSIPDCKKPTPRRQQKQQAVCIDNSHLLIIDLSPRPPRPVSQEPPEDNIASTSRNDFLDNRSTAKENLSDAFDKATEVVS